MALPELQVAKTLPDAWDYKGRPAVRATTGGWISAAMILGPAIVPIKDPLHALIYIIFVLYIMVLIM